MIRKYKALQATAADDKEVASPALNDFEQQRLETLKSMLASMNFEQLAAYAKENEINIGNVTTAPSAHKRIVAHLEAGALQ